MNIPKYWCECEPLPALAINPERECDECHGFVPFQGPGEDDDIRDFLAWADSMKLPHARQVPEAEE